LKPSLAGGARKVKICKSRAARTYVVRSDRDRDRDLNRSIHAATRNAVRYYASCRGCHYLIFHPFSPRQFHPRTRATPSPKDPCVPSPGAAARGAATLAGWPPSTVSSAPRTRSWDPVRDLDLTRRTTNTSRTDRNTQEPRPSCVVNESNRWIRDVRTFGPDPASGRVPPRAYTQRKDSSVFTHTTHLHVRCITPDVEHAQAQE
jgi:hypothetical protein